MHSQIFKSHVVAILGVAAFCWPIAANSMEWYEGQEILVECPSWDWEASQIPGVVYELCFDDIDQCTAAEIGETVCIPGLGGHDVWVTAIEDQDAGPVYYDGEIVSIRRMRSADFNDNRQVDWSDLFGMLDAIGVTGDRMEDLDGNGVVDLGDLISLLDDLGKCIGPSGELYEAC